MGEQGLDLAMAGATPRWLTAAFVLEEGFPIADLKDIVADMAGAAEAPSSSMAGAVHIFHASQRR